MHRERSRSPRRRTPIGPLNVIGELLLLTGLGVLGYIVWQPWHTSLTVGSEQRTLAAAEAEAWDAEVEDGGDAGDAGTAGSDEIPVTNTGEPNEVFAVLHVPAFGLTYANRIAESTSWEAVLNSSEIGIGHYETTQAPGEPGNFAIAAHRSGPITTPFREVMNLRLGDPLFVETQEGWYTYRFRSIEYTMPDAGDVLSPFPRVEGEPGTDQILTLTTCHPKLWGNEERAIAYAVLDEFQPRSDGTPAELTELGGGTQA